MLYSLCSLEFFKAIHKILDLSSRARESRCIQDLSNACLGVPQGNCSLGLLLRFRKITQLKIGRTKCPVCLPGSLLNRHCLFQCGHSLFWLPLVTVEFAEQFERLPRIR